LPATRRHTVSFNFRPVLCYAPPLALSAAETASSGALPHCSVSTQFSASNLSVNPDSNNVNGYTYNSNILPDSQFASYPSTSTANITNDATVLLPGIPALGSLRYVLGPAAVTQIGVRLANATFNNGQWAVNLHLTAHGSSQWDSLSQDRFHQVVAVVLNGRVLSAPIMQPTQTSWSSFNGQVEIVGSFTQQQAKAIAADF
jgi:preprotein translocase subunit SecD